jgi:hypothetical protein
VLGDQRRLARGESSWIDVFEDADNHLLPVEDGEGKAVVDLALLAAILAVLA